MVIGKTQALHVLANGVTDAAGESFIVSELIYESNKSLIYRAERTTTKDAVIIKIIHPEAQTPQAIARIKREYELIKTLDIPGIRRCLGVTEISGGVALILEDVGANTLRNLIEARNLTLAKTLDIFIEFTTIMAAIHTRGVIHKDINPANILVHPTTLTVYLIDFDIAARLTREQVDFGTVEAIEGTLSYVSPEQTGRTGHPLDERTDLYSMGATFYEALTSSCAFTGDTPIDLVYAHLARLPKPPSEVNVNIPMILSQLILKLLAKDPSARYKSALGVKYDLMEIRRRLFGKPLTPQAAPSASQLKAGGAPILTLVKTSAFDEPDLILGGRDAPLRLNISQKIYGRDEQRAQLVADFGYAEIGGSSVSLIAGSSGSGKTSLIMELSSSILRTRATFVTGKFEELRRDIPYDAIIRALRNYVTALNSSSNEEIQSFTKSVIDAVAPNCQVLIDAIPELAPMLGQQPALEPLNPNEQKNRFQQAFVGLIKAMIRNEHPLILFMDDLQWADFASIDLIGQFILDSTLGRILLIGAYRDNEISATHPLSVALRDWEQNSIRVSTINLGPMSLAAINELCSDSLQLDTATTEPLAQIVLAKTGGNPFFVHQFLRALYRDKYIDFDIDRGSWVFEIDQLQQAPFTANIIELLSRRINDLSEESLTILRFASCLGGTFDLYTLAQSMDKPLVDVAKGLSSAIHDDLIIPIGEAYRYIDTYLSLPTEQQAELAETAKTVKYRFAHDRVRETSYLSLEESQRVEIRLKVGRTLKGKKGQALSEEDLMGALNHLNAAESLITDPVERLDISHMNYLAGQRAQSASSWSIAAVLYKHGIKFLPRNSWQSTYELTRQLHLGSGSCNTLSGAFAEAEDTFKLLLKESDDNVSIAQIQHLRAILYITMQKNDEAIDVGLAGLKALGIKQKKYPFIVFQFFGLMRTQLKLSGYTDDELINLQRSDDPIDELVTKMIIDLGEPCLLVNPILAVGLVCKEINYTLKQGINRYSPHAFLQMSATINGSSVSIATPLWYKDEIPRLCHIWRSLLVMWPEAYLNDRQRFVWAITSSHWDDNVASHIRKLTGLVPRFVAAGDIAYTLYTLCTFVDHSQLLGENLSDLVDRVSQFYEYSQNLKFEIYTTALRILYGSITTLSSKNTAAELKAYADGIPIGQELKGTDMTTYCNNLMTRSTLYFTVGDYERALAGLLSCHKVQVERVFFGTIKLVWFYTYLTIILAHLFSSMAWHKKPYYLYIFIRSWLVLRLYKQMSLKNFRPNYLIGKAMWRKLWGRPLASYSTYLEEAIKYARLGGSNNGEAYAAELLGKSLLDEKQYQMAIGPLTTARRAFGRWGIRYKMHELDLLISDYSESLDVDLLHSSRLNSGKMSHQNTESSLYKGAITKNGTTIDGSITMSTIGTNENSTLDAPTLVRAAQALSGEIHLQELKKKMMRLVCENAGARSAYLLMPSDEARNIEDTSSYSHLKIVASARIDNDIIVEIASRDPSSDILSTKAMQYVARTKEQLIIGDAMIDPGWRDDKSLKARRIRSVLALPIIAGGSMKGILYLENELIPHAFTQERIQLLNMLSGQMAISLENATLYAKLEASLQAEREARGQERAAHEDYVKAEGARQVLSANIEAARAVQESLLYVTKGIPTIKMAQFYRPAERAGGDWFACYYDQRQQRMYIFLGDVTGHGVSTALVTAAAAGAAASAMAQVIAEPRSLDLSLHHVGLAMHEAVKRTGTPSGRMMTMTMVAIDIITGVGHYINAGHTPIVHLSDACHEILSPGSPLGIDEIASFGKRNFQLKPGDQIFLYSDGLIENPDSKGIALSRTNLRRTLQDIKDPDAIVARLTPIVDNFAVGPRTDDTAFIALLWSPPIDTDKETPPASP